MSASPYSTKQLTLHLRQLAAETETMDDKGDLITKGETLARLVWKKALGWREEDPKTAEIIEHRPEAWAIQMIWERMEGRTPVSIPDEKDGLTTAEKVSELARARINAEADALVGQPGATDSAGAVSEYPADLDVSDHGAEGPEGSDD